MPRFDVPGDQPKRQPAYPAPGMGDPRRFHLAVLECGRLLFWSGCFGMLWLAGNGRLNKAAMLRRYILRLGPLYIKVGQVLGTQTGLFGPNIAHEFRQFFSDLPPMPTRALRDVIRCSVGCISQPDPGST